jgi:hypothetical protein
MTLTEELAGAFARVALANVTREYPRRVDHLLTGPAAFAPQRVVHPSFYGSYDWHSAVHMHWLLVRVVRTHPQLALASEITARLDAHLAPQSMQAELAYFESPAGRMFERPYGWAWLLELQAEVLRANRSEWAAALHPLAALLAHRLREFVSRAPYPIRAGTHGNTAFACVLALDYARTAQDEALELALCDAARRWHGRDRDAPIAHEPSLDDFLSPSLIEALLMREVLERGEFERWLREFLPGGIGPLAHPPAVADRTDAKQSHLDGLSLSRAWCLSRLGGIYSTFADPLLAAGLPHVAGGDYVGEHWLASFAALALGDRP